jgi:hypothetical protein
MSVVDYYFSQERKSGLSLTTAENVYYPHLKARPVFTSRLENDNVKNLQRS